MKHIIEFNLPEDREELKILMSAGDLSLVVDDVANEIFRPARKHGYSEQYHKLNELINQNPELATDIIEELEKMFFQILENHNITL
jgi:hypothetical protein